MGLFNIFKKKEPLTDEQIKWNYLWDLWSQEEIGAPYDALMTYDSEINNGGHAQFFYNVSNCGDLAKAIKNLREVLPTDLGNNLQKAYDVFLKSAEEENEELDNILSECDNFFYDNENLVTNILQTYANENIEI